MRKKQPVSVHIGVAATKGGVYAGLHVAGHLDDVTQVLRLLLHNNQTTPMLNWSPKTTPHQYAPADINKGTSLPCCDLPEDNPIHTKTPLDYPIPGT